MATAVLQTDYLDFKQSGTTRAKITASDEATLTFSGNSSALVKLSGLATPTAGSDAVTKSYADSKSYGLNWKAPVQVATTANINGLLSPESLFAGNQFDGVTLKVGDRVLVKNQNSAEDNGIYVVRGSWPGSAPQRAADMASGSNAAGAAVFVESGTANKDCAYVCTNNKSNGEVSILNNLQFALFASAGEITGGNGLTRTGMELSVNVDNSTLEITANTLNVKNAGVTNAKLVNRAVTVTAGNGLGGGGSVSLGSSVSLQAKTDDLSIGINSNAICVNDFTNAPATPDIYLAASNSSPAYTNPSAPVVSGSVFQFRGNGSTSGQYLDYGSQVIDLSKGFSFQAKFMFTQSTNWQRLFDFNQGQNLNTIVLAQAGNSFCFQINIGTNGTMSLVAGTITFGQMQTVAAVYDPSAKTHKLYVEGVLVGTYNLPSAITDTRTLPYTYVGRSSFSTDNYANMDIEYLRIYNKTLTIGELQAATITPDYYLAVNGAFPAYYTSPFTSSSILQFRGVGITSGNYLQYGTRTFDMSNGFSFIARVNFLTAGNWQRLFDFGNGPYSLNFGFSQSNSYGVFRFFLYQTNGHENRIDCNLSYNTWYTIAGSYKASTRTMTLYVNGSVANTGITNSPITDIRTLPYTYVGRSNWSDDHYANMDLEYFQFFNSALTIEELNSGLSKGVSTSKINNVAVTTAKIADTSVGTSKINNMAVSAAKITDLAVTTAKIANLAVTTAKIANLAVTTAKIDTSAVTTAKILDANVTNAKLANSSLTVSGGAGLASVSVDPGDNGLVSLGGSVSLSVNVDNSSIEINSDALQIKDSGITTSKISDAAITTAKINDAAVTNAKLVNSSLSVLAGAGLGDGGSADLGSSVTLSVNVDGSSIEIDTNADALQIKDLGITTGKLNDSAVTTVKICDVAVTTDKLSASAVTTAKINSGAITEDKLATSAVTTTKILDANVTNAKLENSSLTVSAGTGLVYGGSVSLGGEVSLSVNVDGSSIEIDADALRIKDSGVTTARITDTAVTTSKISDSAVTNAKLANYSLSVLAGEGLGGGGSVDLGSSVTLSVNVDDSSIEINTDALQLKDLGITTSKLDDSAVTTVKIYDSAVTANKLDDAAVITAKINDGAVTADKLATSAITTAKINDAAVTNAKLANSGVTVSAGAGLVNGGSVSLGEEVSLSVNVDNSSIEINGDALRVKDLGVATSKINDSAITAVKIEDSAVTNNKLANPGLSVLAGAGLGGGGSVDLGGFVTLSVNVDDSSIEIDADALRLKDLGVATAMLNNGAATSAKINNAGITTATIAGSAVTTTKILNANVTNAKLENSEVSITAGDGLRSGGAVSLGGSVSLEVDSSVVRTSGAQTVDGAKTLTSSAAVSDSTASSSSSTGCLTLAGGLGVDGKIYAGSEVSAVAFNATSDATLKTGIAPITGALQKVGRIDPVEFKFNFIENDCTRFGVLAQQLEESGLDFMVRRSGTRLAVEYNSLTGLLLAAVKDLSAEIYELESRLLDF